MATFEVLHKNSATACDTRRLGLNQAQIHLLQLVSHIQTDNTLKELKRLIRDHYAHKLQENADKYWTNGAISDDLINEHLRTEYK